MVVGSVFNINSKVLYFINKCFFWVLIGCFFISPLTLLASILVGYILLFALEKSTKIKENHVLLLCTILFLGCLIIGYESFLINRFIFYRYNMLDFLKAYFGTNFRQIFACVNFYGVFGTLTKILSSFLLIDYQVPYSKNPDFIIFHNWFFSIHNYIFILTEVILFLFYYSVMPHSKKALRIKVAESGDIVLDNKQMLVKSKKLGECMHQKNCVDLGITSDLKVYAIPDKFIRTHVLVVGVTGGGKTVTMFNFIEHAIQNKTPAIIIDGKGNKNLIYSIKACAEHYKMPFKLFSLSSDIANEFTISAYNPFSIGLETEHKEKLIELVRSESSSAGADYYKNIDAGLVQFVFALMRALNKKIDLFEFSKCLDAKKIHLMMLEVDTTENITESTKSNLVEQYKIYKDILEDAQLSGIKQVVNNFVYSQVGDLFKTSDKEHVINLYQDCIENNTVVLFSLSAGGFPELVRGLGELIIIDCNAIASKVENTLGSKPVAIVADEFTAISSKAIRQTLSRNRSAGMYCILGSQSMGVIESDNKALAKDIEANHGLMIAHIQASSDDAEKIAGNLGTIKAKQVTAQIGETGSTGTGSFRETREFLVHPDEIKRLKNGEAFVYSNHDFVCKKIVSRYSSFLDSWKNSQEACK